MAIVAVTGLPTVNKILAVKPFLDTDLEKAFAGAAIPACGTTPPLCYTLVSSTDFSLMTTAQLAAYKVIVVGSDADAATLGALVARKNDILSWTVAGGGLITYAQASLLTPWEWIPKIGGKSVTPVVEHGEDVKLSLKGQTHPTHLNQQNNGPMGLSNWGESRTNYFTAWPSYFDEPIAGNLTEDSAHHAISLAGKATQGCVFVSGQPVDNRAAAGVLSARELFRSTINYAVTCSV